MMNFSREFVFQRLFTLLTAPLIVTGNTHSSNVVDGLSSTIGLCFGEPVDGPGFQANTKITAVDEAAKSITLSLPTTTTVTKAALTVTPYKFTSRKLYDIPDLGEDKRPSLIQCEPEENFNPEFTGQPTMQILNVFILIVVWTKSYNGPGISLVNPRLDALDQVLAPPPLLQAQTLGFIDGVPVVNHCWIEGKITKVGGDLDGNGVAIVPLKLLVPA